MARITGVRSARLGYAYARVGRRAEAVKIVRELESLSKNQYVPSYEIALVHAGLGDKTESLAWLEKGVRKQRRAYVVALSPSQPVL